MVAAGVAQKLEKIHFWIQWCAMFHTWLVSQKVHKTWIYESWGTDPMEYRVTGSRLIFIFIEIYSLPNKNMLKTSGMVSIYDANHLAGWIPHAEPMFCVWKSNCRIFGSTAKQGFHDVTSGLCPVFLTQISIVLHGSQNMEYLALHAKQWFCNSWCCTWLGRPCSLCEIPCLGVQVIGIQSFLVIWLG